MSDLLTVLADPGMQAVLIALGSLLIGALAASAWLLRHDEPFPRCGCARCATTTGDLPDDMRMEK